jgi:hypothetical protein
MDYIMICKTNILIFLSSMNRLVFVMKNLRVYYEVRTKFSYDVYRNFTQVCNYSIQQSSKFSPNTQAMPGNLQSHKLCTSIKICNASLYTSCIFFIVSCESSCVSLNIQSRLYPSAFENKILYTYNINTFKTYSESNGNTEKV